MLLFFLRTDPLPRAKCCEDAKFNASFVFVYLQNGVGTCQCGARKYVSDMSSSGTYDENNDRYNSYNPSLQNFSSESMPYCTCQGSVTDSDADISNPQSYHPHELSTMTPRDQYGTIIQENIVGTKRAGYPLPSYSNDLNLEESSYSENSSDAREGFYSTSPSSESCGGIDSKPLSQTFPDSNLSTQSPHAFVNTSPSKAEDPSQPPSKASVAQIWTADVNVMVNPGGSAQSTGRDNIKEEAHYSDVEVELQEPTPRHAPLSSTVPASSPAAQSRQPVHPSNVTTTVVPGGFAASTASSAHATPASTASTSPTISPLASDPAPKTAPAAKSTTANNNTTSSSSVSTAPSKRLPSTSESFPRGGANSAAAVSGAHPDAPINMSMLANALLATSLAQSVSGSPQLGSGFPNLILTQDNGPGLLATRSATGKPLKGAAKTKAASRSLGALLTGAQEGKLTSTMLGQATRPEGALQLGLAPGLTLYPKAVKQILDFLALSVSSHLLEAAKSEDRNEDDLPHPSVDVHHPLRVPTVPTSDSVKREVEEPTYAPVIVRSVNTPLSPLYACWKNYNLSCIIDDGPHYTEWTSVRLGREVFYFKGRILQGPSLLISRPASPGFSSSASTSSCASSCASSSTPTTNGASVSRSSTGSLHTPPHPRCPDSRIGHMANAEHVSSSFACGVAGGSARDGDDLNVDDCAAGIGNSLAHATQDSSGLVFLLVRDPQYEKRSQGFWTYSLSVIGVEEDEELERKLLTPPLRSKSLDIEASLVQNADWSDFAWTNQGVMVNDIRLEFTKFASVFDRR